MHRTLPLAGLVLLAACTEGPHPTELVEPSTAAQFSSAPTITAGPFFPVAECEEDIGHDIRFGGERVLMTHTTVDGQGQTHTIMQFRVQDFMGWEMPEPAPPTSAPDYEVQGGAEMFSIHRDEFGANVILIHQGNLVFKDLETGERVIAHHTIRNVPGQQDVSFWSCRAVG